MTPLIIIQTTFPMAHNIAPLCQSLIDGKMAICIKEFAPTKSHYFWNGAIEKSLEVILHIKTYKDFFSTVEEMILKAHPYDTPEIIAIPVDAVTKGYQQWQTPLCLHPINQLVHPQCCLRSHYWFLVGKESMHH